MNHDAVSPPTSPNCLSLLVLALAFVVGCAAKGAPMADMAGMAKEERAVAQNMAAPMPPRDDLPQAPPLPAVDVPLMQPVMAERMEAQPAMGMEMEVAGEAMDAEAGGFWTWELEEVNEDDWGGGDWNGDVVAIPQIVYAPIRPFPVPDYSQPYDGPRVDFRETVYWNPQVRTDAAGKASVSFYLSDSVTSFRATAEGLAGRGLVTHNEQLVASKLPVSIAVKMPLEVNRGDRIQLPITLANDTERAQTAALQAHFGPAFQIVGEGLPSTLAIEAGKRASFFVTLAVVGDGKNPQDGEIRIRAEAANLADELVKTVRVVPEGFPFELAAAGSVSDVVEHAFMVDASLPGTLQATVKLYPSPLSTMVSGTESMLRQPGGCFEQASSSNYPNIMILRYMESNESLDPELMQRTKGYLDAGYGLLTGYETPEKGYEWFGGAPGHEALSAYGLMEFADMSGVYDVDQDMVARTAEWLKNRRDGSGGYERNSRALDSFGAASPEVTDAYITYALTEAGVKDLDPEIAHVRELSKSSNDAYILALAANVLLNTEPTSESTSKTLEKLLKLQEKDGSFTKADHSVTRSGGVALALESTSLAVLALLKAGPKYQEQSATAVEWIQSNNNGWGGYGSTQSTVLGLKALTAYAENSRKLPAGTKVTLTVNGKEVSTFESDGDESGEITIGGLSEYLKVGTNMLSLKLDAPEEDVSLAYSVLVSYRSDAPKANRNTKVALKTELLAKDAAMGESVRLHAELRNKTEEGLPMVIARLGLPGGLTFQTWQLKELREKGVIDFYETREREVIVYTRAMAPADVRKLDLDLIAAVPGSYEAPASSAYLYYTDEYKDWVAPVAIDIHPNPL